MKTRTRCICALLVGVALPGVPLRSNAQTSAPQVQVATASAHVRSGAGTGYPLVATVLRGTVLGVLGSEGDWVLVSLPPGTSASATSGYINAAAVRPLGDASVPAPTSAPAARRPAPAEPPPTPAPVPTYPPPVEYPPQPQTQPKQHGTSRSRYTLSAGYGNSYGGLGLELATPSNRDMSFHIGGGYFPMKSVDPNAENMLMGAAGVRLYLDGIAVRSRSYLDLQFGMLGGEYNRTDYYQNGVLVARAATQQALYGPSMLLGRDIALGGGNLMFRIAGGGSYNLAKVEWKPLKWLWALDIGLTAKL